MITSRTKFALAIAASTSVPSSSRRSAIPSSAVGWGAAVPSLLKYLWNISICYEKSGIRLFNSINYKKYTCF